MPKTFTFKSKDFDEAELEQFSMRVQAGDFKGFTVSESTQRAADDKIMNAAKEMQFKSKRPMQECIAFVLERNPVLAKISRASVTYDKMADVTVL
jgi:hypothetical protein